MTNKIVKCSKCKKGICYIPDGYTMGVKVICVACNRGKKVKKKKTTKRTLSASYARMKKGKRLDIHPTYSFKSANEINFARILNYLNLDWRYEERAFTFDGYKRKPHVYIMDFEILGQLGPPPEQFSTSFFKPGFYEVKGYMRPESRAKLRRFKKHYQEEFNRTSVILHNKYKKQDIEFCKKQGYPIFLYDELTKIFKPLVDAWE